MSIETQTPLLNELEVLTQPYLSEPLLKVLPTELIPGICRLWSYDAPFGDCTDATPFTLGQETHHALGFINKHAEAIDAYFSNLRLPPPDGLSWSQALTLGHLVSDVGKVLDPFGIWLYTGCQFTDQHLVSMQANPSLMAGLGKTLSEDAYTAIAQAQTAKDTFQYIPASLVINITRPDNPLTVNETADLQYLGQKVNGPRQTELTLSQLFTCYHVHRLEQFAQTLPLKPPADGIVQSACFHHAPQIQWQIPLLESRSLLPEPSAFLTYLDKTFAAALRNGDPRAHRGHLQAQHHRIVTALQTNAPVDLYPHINSAFTQAYALFQDLLPPPPAPT